MHTSYHITQKGLMYALASRSKNALSLLLFHVLENYMDQSISFDKICDYFDNNKQTAFTYICKMLELEVIDLDETPGTNKAIIQNSENTHLNEVKLKDEFVLSDLNGFPIVHAVFSQKQALQIAAVACDLIRVSNRSRLLSQETESFSPVSLEIANQDKDVTIFLLHLRYSSFLLSSTNSQLLKLQSFIRFISFLIYRYDNE